MSDGFVIAMIGHLVIWRPLRPRRVYRSAFIVSRSGPGGRLLLIGMVGRIRRLESAALVPRITVAGGLLDRRGVDGTLRFTLLSDAPAGVVVAGHTCPAAGLVLVSRHAPASTLRVAARLPGGLRCTGTMRRTAWIGEVMADLQNA